jgi:hypothetical protein
LAILSFLFEIRVLLYFGLVQAVDDGVLALWHQYPLDLLLILKANLAYGHAAILLEVRPRRVDDRDVIFLVAWSFLTNVRGQDGNF